MRGHQISQARVMARVGDREILTVIGALGTRPNPLAGQWSTRPDVPPPADCPPRPLMNRHQGTIMDRFESKLADARPYWELTGSPGSGNASLWVRLPELQRRVGRPRSRSSATSCRSASGRRSVSAPAGTASTTRCASRTGSPTEWVLADVRVHAVADGFGHGLVHLWAENGTLLGTASQSTIVRAHGPVDETPAAPSSRDR